MLANVLRLVFEDAIHQVMKKVFQPGRPVEVRAGGYPLDQESPFFRNTDSVPFRHHANPWNSVRA
jgi:hypothetical protein